MANKPAAATTIDAQGTGTPGPTEKTSTKPPVAYYALGRRLQASTIRETAIVGTAIVALALAASLAGVFDTEGGGALTAEGVTSGAPSVTVRSTSGTPGPSSIAGEGEVSIVSLTSPVSLGATASLTARASPGANCSIVYTHPSGKTSIAPGLDPQVAGSDGTVTWTWLISNGTRPVGNGSVGVTCDGKSVRAPIVIH